VREKIDKWKGPFTIRDLFADVRRSQPILYFLASICAQAIPEPAEVERRVSRRVRQARQAERVPRQAASELAEVGKRGIQERPEHSITMI